MFALLLAGLLLAAYTAVAIVTLLLRRRSFARFARRSQAASVKPMIKKRGLPFGIDHKIRMMYRKSETLFGEYYFKKYEVSGPTHGIYDSLGGLRAVHSTEPENLKAVLCTSFSDWMVSKSRRISLMPLARGGVLTTEGMEWFHNRKIFQKHLNSAKSRDLREMEDDMRLFFAATGEVNDEGWTLRELNMSDLLRRLTLDASTRFLFGVTAEAQASGILEDSMTVPSETKTEMQAAMAKYTEALQYSRTVVTARGAMGSAGWMVDSFKYRRACSYLQQFTEILVTNGLKNPGAACLVNQMYVELQDPIQVRDNLLELVLGGQNMTSSILEWALAELELRPEMYERLRSEILATFGPETNFAEDKDNDQLPKVDMTWNNFKKCQTLQNILNETLRCYPTLANIGKTAAKDTILPRGGGPDGSLPVAVSKGATFTCNVFLMHRRKEFWGEDAWDWNPDRWTNRTAGSEFAPFGGGQRICVGKQLSMTQMSFVLARFVQHFEAIRAPEGANNLAMQYRPGLAPKKVRLFLKKQA